MTHPLFNPTVQVELEALLKRHSDHQKRWGGPDFVSNTPDDTLAEYLLAVLRALGATISQRGGTWIYPSPLQVELEHFVSRHSLDKEMNTTYHFLTEYLGAMMVALDATIKRRDQASVLHIFERIGALTDEQIRRIMDAPSPVAARSAMQLVLVP